VNASLAIETRGLARRFPGGHGVHGLDLAVPAGAVYGFLGPNGAGKTTTIRLLLSLLRPDAGTIAVFGRPLDRGNRAALAGIGALVESPSLYGHLTGRENLEVTRRLVGAPRPRVDAVLRLVELAGDADRLVRTYSLGMRQRLALALALLGEPRLLVLDEPTNGLDPAGIQDFRALLRRLTAEQGVTVFLSSHLLPEVEQVATHLGVLDAGRLLFQGTLAELRRRAPARLHVDCDDPARAAATLRAAGEQVLADGDGGLSVAVAQRRAAELNRLLVESGVGVSRLASDDASLESLFLALTRREETRA
jgi:ABC-2 type transport system ATP-binding protein